MNYFVQKTTKQKEKDIFINFFLFSAVKKSRKQRCLKKKNIFINIWQFCLQRCRTNWGWKSIKGWERGGGEGRNTNEEWRWRVPFVHPSRWRLCFWRFCYRLLAFRRWTHRSWKWDRLRRILDRPFSTQRCFGCLMISIQPLVYLLFFSFFKWCDYVFLLCL